MSEPAFTLCRLQARPYCERVVRALDAAGAAVDAAAARVV